MSEYPPPRWDRIYAKFFPEFTDPTSRFARLIADYFRKTAAVRNAIFDYDDPDRLARAIEDTVVMLWEARKALHDAGYELVLVGNRYKWKKRP